MKFPELDNISSITNLHKKVHMYAKMYGNVGSMCNGVGAPAKQLKICFTVYPSWSNYKNSEHF